MSTTAIIAVTAAPRTLAETVDHEALAYRAWGTPEGDFLSHRWSGWRSVIRLTEAETPGDFEDRLEVYECDLRAREYDRGFEDGMSRSYCPR